MIATDARSESWRGARITRLGMEVVQATHPEHLRRKSRRKRYVHGVGEMLLAINRIIVKLGFKRVLNLANAAAERNFRATAGNTIHSQTLRLQP